MRVSAQCEESEEICALRKKNLSLHWSVHDKENSLDLAHLAMDRDVSQVQRLPATNSRFAGNSNVFGGIPKTLKILILHVVTDTSLSFRQ